MNAQNIDIPRSLLLRGSVNLTAVLSAIWGPYSIVQMDTMAVEIQNPDVSQTIDCYIDVATNLAGPFSTSPWQGLRAIQPGETRSASFDKTGQSIIRLIAQASGAGISNVIVSVAGVERRVISGGT